MSDSEPDPVLAELRERRRRALIDEARAPPAAPPPAGVTVLTADGFDAFVAGRPAAVVDLWAPWCGPCRAVSPIVEGLARELAGAVAFGKVNVDEEPGVAQRYQVQGIPTLLVFRGGRLADRIVGALAAGALRDRLARTLPIPPRPGGAPAAG